MAEEVKDKERTIDKEPELLELLESVRDQIEQDGQLNVKHVDERYSNNMGYFTFSRNGKKMMSNIMLVHVVNEQEKTGENRIYMQDEKENYSELAREIYNTENPTEKRMIKRNGVELDEKLLSEQIERSKQQQREREEAQVGEYKGGDGRDLPQEQHEKKQVEQEEKKDDRGSENQNQAQDGKSQEKLELLDNEIIQGSAKIRLDTLINGYFLWEILQIQSKEYQETLPDGVTAEEFRNGYLSFVDSKELEAKDGKTREQKETFVISTYSGKTVELTTLNPKEMGTLQQQRQSEQSDTKSVNGEMVDGPDTDMTTTRTSLYEIPNVHTQFNNGENWYLAVEDDKGYKENAKVPTVNKTKQISFGQLSRETSDYYRNERIGGDGTKEHPGAVWTKLESIEEPTLSKGEQGQQEQLADQDGEEVLKIKGHDAEQIVNRFEKKYPELYDKATNILNRNDMIKFVREDLDTSGKTNDEAIEDLAAHCDSSIEKEHDQHSRTDKMGY